ncbi:MAG: DUF3575 domain-containing protein [Bacteroidales bacterium]|nr:DUF3575 domain-containing protein [Bacteroidales bacterium]
MAQGTASAPAVITFVTDDNPTPETITAADRAGEELARQRLAYYLANYQVALIQVRSGASPDGSTDSNRQRSDQRAAKALNWLNSIDGIDLETIPCETKSVGEDYETLAALLQDSDIPNAQKAIHIIETVPIWVIEGGKIVSSRKKQLMDLRGGTWNLMREQLFPELQQTQIVINFEKPGTDRQPSSSRPIRIYFPLNDHVLHALYYTNMQALQQLDSLLRAREYTPDDVIQIVGYSSPEGVERHNYRLAARRAESVQRYVESSCPDFAGTLMIRSGGEAWVPFRKMVQQDTELSEDTREKMLGIIDSDIDADSKEAKLKQFSAWSGYVRNQFRDFRVAQVSSLYPKNQSKRDQERLQPVQPAPVSGIVRPAEQLWRPLPVQEETSAWKTIFAVKTNLAYDALTMLNYAIEVPLGDRFSVVWEHYFPWWVMRNNRICVEYLTLGGEARWWFAPQPRPATARRVERDRLVGHYLGAYGFWGKADLQWDRIGCYQCYPVWSAGLTYGFVFPVSKHLNLELSASFGYARIPYQHYIPSDDWQILWRDHDDAGTTHYFGPTKLQVTLAWPIRVKYRVREGAKR